MKRLALLLVAGTLYAQEAYAQENRELATLRYVELVEGTGAPAAAGKRYTLHYVGTFHDGKKFDSSRDKNKPFEFVQGKRQVIPGFDIGFEGMKVGGLRRLLVPSQLAYGAQGSGKTIPPNTDLIFEVELLGVSDVPEIPAAIDLLLPYQDLETRTLALEKSGKLGAHAGAILAANRAALMSAGDQSAPEGLAASFAAVRKGLETARSGFLSGDAEVMGKPSTRRGVFTALIATIAEELGRAEALVP